MREGKSKSRTYRRIHKRTPGGRTVLVHEKRNFAKARCADCGSYLQAIPRLNSTMKSLPKSKRQPTRAHAGKLCSKCSRRALILKARQ